MRAVVLRELRVHFSRQDPAAQGLTAFLNKQYQLLKNKHPTLPILVREANNAAPKIVARFDLGVEKALDVAGMDEDQVKRAVDQLTNH
jgi:NADH dehydrogenase (ubiquinone) 1 alpha subcomplex subunit 2